MYIKADQIELKQLSIDNDWKVKTSPITIAIDSCLSSI